MTVPDPFSWRVHDMIRRSIPDNLDITVKLDNPDDEPLVVHRSLMRDLLTYDEGGNLFLLYMFYYYTAKWQQTNQPKATVPYVATGLQWCEDKVRRVKKKLVEIGLVRDIIQRDGNNRVTGCFVYVRYIWSLRSIQNDKSGNEISALSVFHRPEIKGSNALSPLNKLNALSPEKMQRAKDHITPSKFEDFWAIYPNHIGSKAACRKIWIRISTRKTRRQFVPTWLEVKHAVRQQKKSKQWQNPKYIPRAATWLNQERWTDDPTQLIPPDSDNKPKLGYGTLDADPEQKLEYKPVLTVNEIRKRVSDAKKL